MYFNFKNRIFIHKLFLIFPVFLILKIPLNAYFITLFSAFCHECAHLLASLIKKEKFFRLFITPFGFELSMSIKNKRNELFIISSGPLFSLGAFFVFLMLGKYEWARINFFLFAINILPAFPLDGGRILKILLSEHFGALRGMVLFKKISRYTALSLFILSAWMKNMWLLFVSLLISERCSLLTPSPFLRKRTSPVPVKFYYFSKDVPVSSVLKMISPYSYIGIITPHSKKVLFEWEIMENLSLKGGSSLFSYIKF